MSVMEEKKEAAKIRKVKKDLQLALQSKAKPTKPPSSRGGSIDLSSKNLMQNTQGAVSSTPKQTESKELQEIPEKTME